MIDWPRVEELRQEIGPEDFGEVVELFLEEVEAVIAKLRNGERSQLAENLHFLKGSALNLGFDAFSSHCMDGEQHAAGGDAAGVDLGRIVQSYEDSKTVFLEGLETRA